jgi:hypothetical protein
MTTRTAPGRIQQRTQALRDRLRIIRKFVAEIERAMDEVPLQHWRKIETIEELLGAADAVMGTVYGMTPDGEDG